MESELPIDQFLPEISDSLAAGRNLVLVAEPGSGKTTWVPASLLGESWLAGKKILMLEPRRLAAKAAAMYIASQHGEKAGESIGYRIRGEVRSGTNTRLEILTEALLTRMLQSDAALEDVGLVIFDEFHERTLHADLALALVLDCQRVLRPDLRIMIMSATIDTAGVSELIGNAVVVNCPGRKYPVELRYGGKLTNRVDDAAVTDSIRRAHADCAGDILVFLPGRAEISRVSERLSKLPLAKETEIFELHSDIRGEDQNRILSPRNNQPRRIILSTNVAETSVTIPRVRVVIDSGLMRVPRFNPRRGVAGLETIAVSLASATQRAGRAGREAPGVCYRLWEQHDERNFSEFSQPEIVFADLAPMLLELAAWGNSDTSNYSFMTAPPTAHLAQAVSLLRVLGAIDDLGVITAHGRELLKLSLPPRLSHMLLIAKQKGASKEACRLIALLEEPLPALDRELDGIVSNRLEELSRSAGGRGRYSRYSVQRIEDEAGRLEKLIADGDAVSEGDISIGILIALAYPERLAKQREKGSSRFLMRNGAGAVVPERSVFTKHEYLAIAHLDGLGDNARVFLAEPVTLDEIKRYFGPEIVKSNEVYFDHQSQSVRAREQETLGAIVISERPVACDDETALPILLSVLRERGLEILNFSTASKSLLGRVRWLKDKSISADSLPDLSASFLLESLESWLMPFIPGARSIADISSEKLETALSVLVSRQQLRIAEELAPQSIKLPSGRDVVISYEGPRAPSISGKLQEMFGQAFSPRIAGGRVPLTIELLSPAGRPLQVTSDLESFWANSYQEVRKEMAGRYPKHPWPADPKQALPQRGVKKR